MKKPAKFAEGGRTREYGGQEGTANFDVPQYSLSDIFGTRRKKEETPEKVKEEDSRELAREARMNVPGMGAEASPAPAPSRQVTRETIPPRRRAPRPPRGMTPEERARSYGGGMTEEDIVRATRASQARMRTPEPIRESSFMRDLRRGIMGPEYAAEAEARAARGYTPRYAKGGTVKKAQGGTCRGMGAATRGGNYKFR